MPSTEPAKSRKMEDLRRGTRELAHSSDLMVCDTYFLTEEYLEDAHREAALQLARDADLLLHDAHFSVGEYDSHGGWGHFSDQHAIEIARAANVGRLLLFHQHADLDDIARRHEGETFPVGTAREDSEINLNGSA